MSLLGQPKVTTSTSEKYGTMATSLALKYNLSEGLYTDAGKFCVTDLDMLCPTRSNDEAVVAGNDDCTPLTQTVFHLHYTIVASTSGYFSTFSEPKNGHVINDMDVNSLKICVRFMYLGECDGILSHGNVASILNASELF